MVSHAPQLSARKAVLIQERLLLQRRLATERPVAVRKMAEAGDDPVVMLGPAIVGGAVQRLEQRKRPILIRHGFRVLERQVEEAAQSHLRPLIKAGRQGLTRQAQRQRIGGEGVAGPAKDVARKLIQQDHQGQGSLRRLHPAVELAPGGGEVRLSKPLAEIGVEGGVLGEPLVGSRLFPEGDDVGGRYVCAHDPDPTQSASRLP